MRESIIKCRIRNRIFFTGFEYKKGGADRGQRQHHGDQDAPFGPVRQRGQNGLGQAGAKARQTQQKADGTGIHALFQ